MRTLSRSAIAGLIAALAIERPLVAAKKVRPLSTTATLDSCILFVQEVGTPQKKIAVVEKTRLETYGTMVMTVRDESAVDAPKPPEADRFVAITVILSGSDEVRAAGEEAWTERRPRDLAPLASLVFPDGVVSRAVLGAGFDGLESHVDAIAWGPGTVRTEAGVVVYRNYIWQAKDPFLGTETLYFPVSQEHWKRVKPSALRIGDAEVTFTSAK